MEDAGEVTVRAMDPRDVESADRVMRRAFGTFLRVSDPDHTFGDAQYIGPRFAANPAGSMVAEVDGRLVGSIQATRWGSFAFLGPLTVSEDLWDRGVGRRLMAPVVDLFDQWGVSLAGLFTFAQSAKHVGLYQRFGFWPQHLTAITSREVAPSRAAPPGGVSLVSATAPAERARVLDDVARITGRVFEGLDARDEIASVLDQGLGDTLLVHDTAGVAGVAVCHVGAGEAGSGTAYVKFAAVAPGPGAPATFDRLLGGVEHLAGAARVERIVAGVNTACRAAYGRLLERGYRTGGLGVLMHRPDLPGFSRPDLFVLDDLR